MTTPGGFEAPLGAPDDWLEAIEQAAFSAYEVAEPEPGRRWGGGFGYDQDGDVSSIELCARLDGTDVRVETSRSAALASPELRAQMLNQVGLAIDRLSRPIEVDGRPLEFDGATAKNTWVGIATTASGVTIQVEVGGAALPTALRPCVDWSMARYGAPPGD